MDRYKRFAKVLSLVGLLLILSGVTYAFFNYTRTGTANILSVGSINFSSSQNNTIELNNIFPIKREDALTDSNNSGEVIITISGDTEYGDGIEYLISVDSVSIETSTYKKLPIGIIVTPEKSGELGTSDDSYFTNRGGSSSIYKVMADNTVEEDEYIIVGYIKPGEAEINGTVGIRAFIDLDSITVSDTYDGTESDENGTTRDWVRGRTVLTTEEWNSLSGNNALSFKIKVEANEGIWVPEPTTRNDMLNIYGESGNDYFSSAQKSSITEIEFIRMSEEMINLHSDIIDITATGGQGMVKAWIEGTKLYIASPGTTYFPQHSNSLFMDFSAVTKIIFNNINTSEVTTMSSMFNGCSSLEKLDLSNQGSNNLTNVSGIFSGCDDLTSVNMSNFNFGTSSMQYMFSNAKNLVSVDLSNANTSGVTSMGWLFDGLNKLERVNLSGIDTSNVTQFFAAFRRCSSLTSLDLSSLDTSSATSMTSMFQGCSGLTSINIDNFDFSNVNGADSMFNGCTNITSLDLSKVKFGSSTSLTVMLSGSSIERVNLSGNKIYNNLGGMLQGSDVEIIDMNNLDATEANVASFFTGARKLKTINASGMKFGTYISGFIYSQNNDITSLKTVDLSNANFSLATNSGGLFSGVSGIKTANLKGANFSNITTIGGMFSSGSIESIDLSNADFSSVTNTGGMFSGVGGNTVINLSDVNFSSVTNTGGMFNGSSPSSISLKNATFNSLLYTSGMFSGLTTLTNVDLTGFNTSTVTYMSGMFQNCSSLTSLDLSHLNTSSITNMAQMFKGMTNLESVNLSGLGGDNLENISDLFDYCSSLKTINMSNFNFGAITDLSDTNSPFNRPSANGTANIETINLHGAKMSNITTLSSLFSDSGSGGYYTKIKNIDMSNVQLDNIEDMSYMFSGCTKLENINFKNTPITTVTNMHDMFSNCNALTTIDLSTFNTANVTDMVMMFYIGKGDSNLRTIYVSNLWNTDNVSSSSSMFTNCNSLVGGSGTPYDHSHIDKAYAHIDGGQSNPGYLTLKTN